MHGRGDSASSLARNNGQKSSYDITDIVPLEQLSAELVFTYVHLILIQLFLAISWHVVIFTRICSNLCQAAVAIRRNIDKAKEVLKFQRQIMADWYGNEERSFVTCQKNQQI